MLIATWNVNSVRTRLSQIINWINQVNPDILCLQETKVIDNDFPINPFELVEMIRRQNSMNDATHPSDAIDDALKSFNSLEEK